MAMPVVTNPTPERKAKLDNLFGHGTIIFGMKRPTPSVQESPNDREDPILWVERERERRFPGLSTTATPQDSQA
jgi:hypothetical protein